jgi:two-component system, cell cycle sensor histidine kinase and response regulator CckA
MSIMNHPYMLLLILSAIISAGLAIVTLKFRPSMGTRSFAVLNSSVALWAIVALFEVGSSDPLTKIFSYNLKYLFVVIAPVAWFTFGLYYSNRARHLPLKFLFMLLVLPAVTVLMVATNNYHHLMFTTMDWRHSDHLYLLQRDFGPWFWIHATFCYALLLFGFIFLAKTLMDSPAPYRSQVFSLLVGGLAPWIVNGIFIFNPGLFGYLDLTPFAFTVSGAAFMWGVVRYRLLEIVPVARDVAFQNMKDGVIVVDNDHRIVDLNASAAQILGKPEKALIGDPAGDHLSWWTPTVNAHHDLQGNGIPPTFEQEIAGRRHLFRINRSPIFINNRSMGNLFLLSDITAAKSVENALRDSESRFRSLTENAPVIIFAMDTDGIITYTNPTFTKILGYRIDDVIGRSFHEFVAGGHKNPYENHFRQLIDGAAGIVELNINLLHKNGSERLFNTTAAVDSDPEGRVTGIIGMAKDITDEHKLRHQLFQFQKMEAIGTLAGGIAHDFNNLLMGMQANISLLRLEAAPTKILVDKLHRIEDQIQNGAALTRQLLGYARKGKYVVTTINFHRLIEETLSVVQRTNKNITTDVDFTRDPACVEADRGQIELVLLNLFVNAVDAMPHGGRLRVTTRVVNGGAVADRWTDLAEGTYIETKVMDSGTGMDQATMDRIFEPFFTTKELGRGTGLGLASVYGVVQNHRGRIGVDSRVGKGTTFTLLFPQSKNAVEKTDTRNECCCPVQGHRRILLVDDEKLVLEYCGEIVESLGFDVILAHGGRQAIGIFEKEHEKIDLVILDMVMPEMDGRQVYEALMAIHPAIKVILATGFAFDARAEQILANRRTGYLRKPYTRNQLADAVTTILSIGPVSGGMGATAN